MRKLLLFLVPLIAIAVAYSWWTQQAVSTAELSPLADDKSTQPLTADPASTADSATAEGDQQADPSATGSEAEPSAESAASESLQNATEADSSADDESPFAVVEQPENTANSDTTEEASAGDTQPAAKVEAATDAVEPAGQPEIIVVPESYPVTDAEKYFIPKDQRSPGNLGGPPPLDFPGGPSDPNRPQPGTDIAAPAAPGQ